MDLRLPGTDGIECIELLRAQSELRNILMVAISGTDDIPSVRKAYAVGANTFVTKPIRPVDLENLILGYPRLWERPVLQN